MSSREDIAAMRRQYGEHGLVEGELPKNPIELFNTWLTQAAENEIVVEANAMVLSTEVDNQPTSRTVLLKDLTQAGFTFFSNYESIKASRYLRIKMFHYFFLGIQWSDR
jgi:pyridoxamine 5'-phosphate oxidase